MVVRKLITVTVLVCAGALVVVLSGHLWGRYLQVAEALEFGKTYDRYQASQASARRRARLACGRARGVGAGRVIARALKDARG